MARRPPLHEVHAELGARTTEFGGWTMPVRYGSTADEHIAVRQDVGVFDVSHMGRIRVSGDDAVELTDRLTSNDVEGLDVGEAQYSLVLDRKGCIVDDVLVYRFEDDEVLFVPNAGNDGAMAERWRRHAGEHGFDADVVNETEDTAMLAIQGPRSPEVTADALDVAVDVVDALSRFEAADVDSGTVSRTGYTGEDGFEVVVDVDDVEAVWRSTDATPCGLGARDTLRLEMGYLLAGNEFDVETERRTPFEAGVEFVVDLDGDFVGRDALVERTEPDQRLRGLLMEERGVPRHGYAVEVDGGEVGRVTSGTVSPCLDVGVALAYLDRDVEPGDSVDVVVRGERREAAVTRPPFVDR
ncbi:MAG: glycine cleavage system aminomethyltransferase GcvT [Halobacteriales archaeon]